MEVRAVRNPGAIRCAACPLSILVAAAYETPAFQVRSSACFEAFLTKVSPTEYASAIPKVRAELAARK